MSRTPIVRPVSPLGVVVNLGIVLGFVAAGAFFTEKHGAVIGCCGYLFLSLLLRSVIARHHRRAITSCKRQQYARAIPEFEKSVEFFRRHPWLDRWRAVTMFSTAAMHYREMALVSLGFCHSQLGDGVQSRRYYEQALAEFPANGMAEAALRILDAGHSSGSLRDPKPSQIPPR